MEKLYITSIYRESILNRAGDISPINTSLYSLSNLQATSKRSNCFSLFYLVECNKKKKKEEGEE